MLAINAGPSSALHSPMIVMKQPVSSSSSAGRHPATVSSRDAATSSGAIPSALHKIPSTPCVQNPSRYCSAASTLMRSCPPTSRR
jgi:hypothetical protein